MAKTGTAWEATRNGAIAFSTEGWANMAMESGTATMSESNIPINTSNAVIPAWGSRMFACNTATVIIREGVGRIKSGICKVLQADSQEIRIKKTPPRDNILGHLIWIVPLVNGLTHIPWSQLTDDH
jgi:hypothetical protein